MLQSFWTSMRQHRNSTSGNIVKYGFGFESEFSMARGHMKMNPGSSRIALCRYLPTSVSTVTS